MHVGVKVHFCMNAVRREVDRTLHNRGRTHAALGDMILKGEMYSALSEEVIGFDERLRVFVDAQT